MRKSQLAFDKERGIFYDTINAGEDETKPLFDFMCHESWAEYVLADLCGLCGCADYEKLMPLMAEYLSGEWNTEHTRAYREKTPSSTMIDFDSDDMVQTMVAWFADIAGFTEHGGNISGSWLTDAGKHWLELFAQVPA